MHYIFLVEDRSGKVFLEQLADSKLALTTNNEHTFEVHSYKGIGHLPKKGTRKVLTKAHGLLTNLPKLLQGFGQSHQGIDACAFVVCDSDNKIRTDFLNELNTLYQGLNNPIKTYWGIATEEMEAWLLGDWNAILSAYPSARQAQMSSYQQDSVCGTWEVLARVLGHNDPTQLSWQEAGELKSEWAKAIVPHMKLTENKSPSFQEFIKHF